MGTIGVSGSISFEDLDKACLLYITIDSNKTPSYNNGKKRQARERRGRREGGHEKEIRKKRRSIFDNGYKGTNPVFYPWRGEQPKKRLPFGGKKNNSMCDNGFC